MADVKVLYEVSVGDDGTPRLVESTRKVTDATDRADETHRRWAGTMQNAVATAVGFLAAQALPRLAGAIGDTIERSSKLNSLENAFDSLSASIGLNADTMRTELRSATQGLISDFDLIEKTNNALTLGIVESQDQWTQLAGAGVKLGRAVGLNATQAIESLTIGLGRQSKLVLDNLGIIVDSEGAYKRYAAELGKTQEALTETERKTAFLNAAQSAILAAAERAGEAQLVLGDRIQQARVRLGNWIDSMIRVVNESPQMQMVLNEISRIFGEQGGILDTLVVKFRENLPGAIGFTLEAFKLAIQVAMPFRLAWSTAISGVATIWDLLVVAINKGTALALRAFNALISAMRATQEETADQAIAWNLLQGQLDTMADHLDGKVNNAFERIRTRSGELGEEWDRVINQTADISLAIEDFQARLNSASDTANTVAAPAARNLGSALGEANEQLLDGAPAAVDYRDAVGDLPPVLQEAEQKTVDVTRETLSWDQALNQVFSTIRTGKQWLDNLISSVGSFIGAILQGQGPLQAFGSAIPGIGGLLGSVGGTGGGIAGNILGALGQGGPLAGLLGGGAATIAGGAGLTGAIPAAVNISGLVGGGGAAAGGAAAGGGLGGLLSSVGGLMTNPITGIVAGGALGAYGLFRLLTKSRKEARTERQAGIFGDLGGISESTNQFLADLSIQATKANRELPDTIASITGLGRVLEETGIRSEKAFTFAFSKAREGIERYQEGLLTLPEVNQALAESFPFLQEAAERFGGASADQLRQLVELAQQAGLAIGDEMAKAVDAVASASEETAESASRKTQEELDKLRAATTTQLADLQQQLQGARGRQRIEIEAAIDALRVQLSVWEEDAARKMQGVVDNSAIAGQSIASNLRWTGGDVNGLTPGLGEQAGGADRPFLEIRSDRLSRFADAMEDVFVIRNDRRRAASRGI